MNCQTCRHNLYLDLEPASGFVMCGHPITQAKMPKFERGDPAWVNMLTADVSIARMEMLADCPKWEAGVADAA